MNKHKVSSIFRRGSLDDTSLEKHMQQEGRPDLVDFQPHGYRDIIWCPVVNEPVIIDFGSGGVLRCTLCGMLASANGSFAVPHNFVVSVIGPYRTKRGSGTD